MICWGTILFILSLSFLVTWYLYSRGVKFGDDLGALLTSLMLCMQYFCIPPHWSLPHIRPPEPTAKNKQNCWYINHMFLGDKGWNRFPVPIVRETHYYTFPVRKASFYIEFLCHICRHDLTKQQCSSPSLVFWWWNIVYYNDCILFIWDSCLKLKKKKKKSYALDVGLFFPTKGLQKFL